MTLDDLRRLLKSRKTYNCWNVCYMLVGLRKYQYPTDKLRHSLWPHSSSGSLLGTSNLWIHIFSPSSFQYGRIIWWTGKFERPYQEVTFSECRGCRSCYNKSAQNGNLAQNLRTYLVKIKLILVAMVWLYVQNLNCLSSWAWYHPSTGGDLLVYIDTLRPRAQSCRVPSYPFICVIMISNGVLSCNKDVNANISFTEVINNFGRCSYPVGFWDTPASAGRKERYGYGV